MYIYTCMYVWKIINLDVMNMAESLTSDYTCMYVSILCDECCHVYLTNVGLVSNKKQNIVRLLRNCVQYYIANNNMRDVS